MSERKGPRPSVPPRLAELLGYLDEIGYRDLYLSAAASPVAAGAPASQRRGAPRGGAPGSVQPAASEAAAPPPSQASGPGAPATARQADPEPPERSSGSAASSRNKTLQILASEASGCTRCRLAETRNQVVFGVGDPAADLMLIGEGPGAEEDRRGEPFVGPAGALLNKILAAIGLERRQVYIANIVKCRPPGNRDPQSDEVDACRSYLDAQIDLIRPKVIVALGRVAAQTLLGTGQSLGRLRGDWHRVRGVETRVTYHPAGLLRNAAWKRPCWEDMQIVRDRLAES